MKYHFKIPTTLFVFKAEDFIFGVLGLFAVHFLQASLKIFENTLKKEEKELVISTTETKINQDNGKFDFDSIINNDI